MATHRVSPMHTALHDFVGHWNVTQKIWSSPQAEPVTNRGKTECSVLLDGLATMMTTEMSTSDFKGVALITYNEQQGRYDLAWLDTISDEGITLMGGQQNRTPSHPRLQAEFGKTATQERSWSTAVAAASACLPSDALAAASTFAVAGKQSVDAALARGTSPVPLRLVENKVSDNHWVLEFFVPGPDGQEFLVQQNTFTRGGKH
jgi:Protein of unknown function (DUF1579)